jgi:tRNA G18 (ribose-2'-O)-methylase SpoU
VILSIERADDPRIAAYADVGAPARLRARGVFVAEGRLVVRRLLEIGRFDVESSLVTPAARAQLADVLDRAAFPVYECAPDLLRAVTGFNFHRGCLAIAQRPPERPAQSLRAARRLLGVEGVGNPDNLGGLFRVAAAFDVDGLVLSPGCADPFYRKAIRTSMGAVLRVPFATAARWPGALQDLRDDGIEVVALTPEAGAEPLAAFAGGFDRERRVLFLLGAEGPGLTAEALALATRRVRIPIASGVDSLNVVVAAGIALATLPLGSDLNLLK